METIGARIKRLMSYSTPALTQKALADLIGIKPSSMSAILNDESKPSAESLLGIAHALNASPEEIMGMKDRISSVREALGSHAYGKARPFKVPLFTLQEATLLASEDPSVDQWKAKTWREVIADVSNKSFALAVQGKAMQNPNGSPSIADGSLLILDPEVQPQHGSIVAAIPSLGAHATIKRLSIDGALQYLEPLNPDYKPQLLDTANGGMILGVARQVIQDL